MTPPPNQAHPYNQNDLFTGVEQVETAAIRGFVRRNVLPRDHDKQIKVKPPREQQKKVERHQPQRMIIPLNVRLHHQGRHHRNDVEEQNHISDKWVRRVLAQKDFEVSPQNLRAQPHPTTEPHQRPEKLEPSYSWFGCSRGWTPLRKKAEHTASGRQRRSVQCCAEPAQTRGRERTPPRTRFPSTCRVFAQKLGSR